jgi:hypothetical protein
MALLIPNIAWGIGAIPRPVKRPAALRLHTAFDHDDFGSIRSEIINVIDSNSLEHDVVRKRFALFGIMLLAGAVYDKRMLSVGGRE